MARLLTSPWDRHLREWYLLLGRELSHALISADLRGSGAVVVTATVDDAPFQAKFAGATPDCGPITLQVLAEFDRPNLRYDLAQEQDRASFRSV
jgi:hypothetical protein